MRDRLLIIGEMAIFLLLVAVAVVVVFYGGATESNPVAPQEKVFRRTLAEGVSVTRYGVYGVEFVKCASCRLEKRKLGLLTLGGHNVLVMEDLSIVIPPEDKLCGESAAVDDGTPRAIVRRLGVSDAFLSSRSLPVKFSGIRISKLTVSRLAAENKVELVFSAHSAEAVRGGLALSGCVIVRPTGERENVGKAMLRKTKQKLRLSWRGGELDLT